LPGQQAAHGVITEPRSNATGSIAWCDHHALGGDRLLHPGGNCTNAIVQTLGEAKRTILMQAYSFTSAPIAKALLDAHKRGVQVQVTLDKSQRGEKYSSADFLANQGVPTMIDANHAISHNKVIVIDGELVLRGSFNFTKAAQEKNAENLLIIRDPALAAQYTQNWEAHRQHSQPYVGRGER
jgi:phosphatidylserine/phosphatidylglycerophosphate/cardiolipin synthase-like enzyme